MGSSPSCDPTTGTRSWPTPMRKPGTRCSCGGRRPGSWNRRFHGGAGAGMLEQGCCRRLGGDGGPRRASQPGKDIRVLHGEGNNVQMPLGHPHTPWGPLNPPGPERVLAAWLGGCTHVSSVSLCCFSLIPGPVPCLPLPVYPGRSNRDGPCAPIPDEQLPDGAGSQAGFAHHVPGSHRLR